MIEKGKNKWTAKIINVSDQYDTVEVYIEFSNGDMMFEKTYHFTTADSLDIETITKLANEEIARIGEMKQNATVLKKYIGKEIKLNHGGDKQ